MGIEGVALAWKALIHCLVLIYSGCGFSCIGNTKVGQIKERLWAKLRWGVVNVCLCMCMCVCVYEGRGKSASLHLSVDCRPFCILHANQTHFCFLLPSTLPFLLPSTLLPCLSLCRECNIIDANPELEAAASYTIKYRKFGMDYELYDQEQLLYPKPWLCWIITSWDWRCSLGV